MSTPYSPTQVGAQEERWSIIVPNAGMMLGPGYPSDVAGDGPISACCGERWTECDGCGWVVCPLCLNVDLSADGKFAFVEFRDEDICTLALTLFDKMEVCGRNLNVGRPRGYIDPGPGGPTRAARTAQTHNWCVESCRDARDDASHSRTARGRAGDRARRATGPRRTIGPRGL